MADWATVSGWRSGAVVEIDYVDRSTEGGLEPLELVELHIERCGRHQSELAAEKIVAGTFGSVDEAASEAASEVASEFASGVASEVATVSADGDATVYAAEVVIGLESGAAFALLAEVATALIAEVAFEVERWG